MAKFKPNREIKDELREALDEMLDKVEFNPEKRITSLSKDYLETLLFDYDPKKDCKVIGWHSKNLKKIDLSKVSFDGVFLGDEAEKDFSDTNIRLYFSRCHIVDRGGVEDFDYGLYVSNMKLDNVDLSDNSFCCIPIDSSTIVVFDNCSLANTKLKTQGMCNHPKCIFKFTNSNLEGVDLSKAVVNVHELDRGISWENLRFYGTKSFKKTGITLNFRDHMSKEKLRTALSNDKLAGCYVIIDNTKTYMKTPEEKRAEAEKTLEGYNRFVKIRTNFIKTAVRSAIKNRGVSGYKPLSYSNSGNYKLTREDLDKIREEVAKLLRKIDYDPSKRVRLDAELIDTLLFNNCVDDDCTKYRKFGFTDSSINRLDLSNVDFARVSFDGTDLSNERGGKFSLEGTNPNIYFPDTFEFIMTGDIIVKDINLRGVNLRDSGIERCVSKFTECDLRDTHLVLNQNSYATFSNCNLNGVPLGNMEISLNGRGENIVFDECDLRNTGINLKTYSFNLPSDIRKIYKNGDYVGCFIDEVPIISEEEKTAKKEEILKEYKKYAKSTKTRILNLVRNEINENERKD